MRRKYEAEMTASGRKKQRGGRHNSGQTPPIIASPVPPPPQYSHEYHHRQDVMGPPIGHNHIPSQGPPGSTPHVYAPSGVFTGGGPQDFQTHNHFDIAPAMHTPVPVNNTSPYGQEAYSQSYWEQNSPYNGSYSSIIPPPPPASTHLQTTQQSAPGTIVDSVGTPVPSQVSNTTPTPPPGVPTPPLSQYGQYQSQPAQPLSVSSSSSLSPPLNQGFLLSPDKSSLYHDLGIISPLKYFDELGSLSPLKPDRGLEEFKAELDMGAFELLTCSPVKIKQEVISEMFSPVSNPVENSPPSALTTATNPVLTTTTTSTTTTDSKHFALNLSSSSIHNGSFSSLNSSRLSTPPILRRGRRKQGSPTKKHVTIVDANESLLTTPQKMTPVKVVPFSPSQFLNSPNLSFEDTNTLTSTPVLGSIPASQSTPVQSHTASLSLLPNTSTPSESGGQPRTPKSRRALIQPTPKTPTPLKNALREIEKKSGPLKHLPQTPTHLEDITEIIRKDTERDRSKMETPSMNSQNAKNQSALYDSGYGTLKRKAPPASGKENSPSKKARKALVNTWSTPGDIQVPGFCTEPLTLMPETPSKSLIGDSSVLFSPPSIIRDTLPDENHLLNSSSMLADKSTKKLRDGEIGCVKRISFNEGHTNKANLSKLDVRWEMVACGKTENQRRLTEQARQFVTQNASLKPRSLNL